jgi:hypothetical protein
VSSLPATQRLPDPEFPMEVSKYNINPIYGNLNSYFFICIAIGVASIRAIRSAILCQVRAGRRLVRAGR